MDCPRGQLFVRVSNLDFYLNTGSKFQFHQCLDGLRIAAVDVDKALVAAQFELLAALLVHESGAVHSEDALVRRQGYRTRYNSAGSLHSLHDFVCGAVHQVVVVALQFDTDFLTHVVVFVCAVNGHPKESFAWGAPSGGS